MLLLSSSSGRQNALKTEIQRTKEKGIYWDKSKEGKQEPVFGDDESVK